MFLCVWSMIGSHSMLDWHFTSSKHQSKNISEKIIKSWTLEHHVELLVSFSSYKYSRLDSHNVRASTMYLSSTTVTKSLL